MALARSHRLSAGAFRNVFAKGKTAKSSFFFLKAIPNSEGGIRLGISIPAKVVSRAVDRTRLRRRIHRAVASVVKRQTVGYDVVMVITRPEEKEEVIQGEFTRATRHIFHA